MSVLTSAGILLALLSAAPGLAHSGHVYVAGRGTPIIDGDLSDWPADRWQSMSDRRFLYQNDTGPVDLRARFAVQWHDSRLYLAAEVSDEIHSCGFSGSEIWRGDSVQWRLDIDHTPSGPSTVLEWGYALSTQTGKTEVHRWTEELVTLVKASVVRDDTAGVTRYEAEIFLALEIHGPRVIGLAVLVNDSDGSGREGFAEWSSGIVGSKNRGLHGDLLLTDATPRSVQSTGEVGLSDLVMQDVFASFYETYAQEPMGSLRVRNDGPDSLDASLRFHVPGVLRGPQRRDLALAPHSSQLVELRARLDPGILMAEGAQTLEVEVVLSYVVGEQTRSVAATADVNVYGAGALRWDGVERAAAFVTHTDAAVTGFARSLLAAFEQETAALGRPGRNLLQAMLLFEAVRQHGVRYVPDPSTPYAQVSTDASMIDHVQYPNETLRQRAGDCDDLTVLYCALLESAGIATALVDYPEHVFVLLDTGVPRGAAYQLPVDERLYVERGDRLWVPVEVTQIGESFETAWALGAEELLRLPALERRERVVDTREAWRQYPATPPPVPRLAETGPPQVSALRASVDAQSTALQQRIDQHIEATYLDPLKLTPDNDALRTRLLRVYVALQQYETAIEAGLNHLVDRQGDAAATHNHLGIAYYMRGNDTQAVYHFQQASALRPNDAGIRANLDLALRATGREVTSTAVAAVDYAATDSTKAGQFDLADTFYWMESP